MRVRLPGSTRPSPHYPVPQTGMSFKDANFMTPLSADTLKKKRRKGHEAVPAELSPSTAENSEEPEHKR